MLDEVLVSSVFLLQLSRTSPFVVPFLDRRRSTKTRTPVALLVLVLVSAGDAFAQGRRPGGTVTPVFSRAEAVAAAIVSFLAAAILAAYLFDTIGMTLHPIAILIVALAAALTSARGEPVEPRARPSTGSERAFDSGLVPFAIIVSGAMAAARSCHVAARPLTRLPSLSQWRLRPPAQRR